MIDLARLAEPMTGENSGLRCSSKQIRRVELRVDRRNAPSQARLFFRIGPRPAGDLRQVRKPHQHRLPETDKADTPSSGALAEIRSGLPAMLCPA
jgi:hypothetical protein